jgi:hydrogenase expression/formation protein HypE
LKIGKLDNNELRRLVLDRLPAPDRFVTAGPAVGVDCCAIRFGDGQVILSTDPITGATADIGRLAVHIACNDIAACGIRPTALLMVIIAPATATRDDICMVIDQAAAAARLLNVSIVGGHTEISDVVSRFLITCTALGFTYGNQVIMANGGQAGDMLVMTKTAGLEGTAILAADRSEKLAGILSESDLQEARGLIEQISVVEEGSCGGDQGVHAMHDATEGGILGACWELAEASGLGCEINAEQIPVHSLTARICSCLNLDPLRLIASGSLLIALPDPDRLLADLASKGIRGTVIGKLTENKAKRLLIRGETLELQPPGPDELYKII